MCRVFFQEEISVNSTSVKTTEPSISKDHENGDRNMVKTTEKSGMKCFPMLLLRHSVTLLCFE